MYNWEMYTAIGANYCRGVYHHYKLIAHGSYGVSKRQKGRDYTMYNWKVYTIIGANYCNATYHHHKLIAHGGFWVSKRLFKRLDSNLRRITIIKP